MLSREVEAIYNPNPFKCRSDGNPLNSSIAPVPPPTSPLAPSPPSTTPPSPYAFWGPPSGKTPPGKTPPGTPPASAQEKSNSGKANSFFTTKRVVGISIGGVFVLIILVLVVLFLMPRATRRRGETDDRISKPHQIGAYRDRENPPMDNGSLVQPNNQLQKG